MRWFLERPGAPVSPTRKPIRAFRIFAVGGEGRLASYSIIRPQHPPWTRRCKEFGWVPRRGRGFLAEASPGFGASPFPLPEEASGACSS